MSNFRANYDKILEVLRSITNEESFLIQIREPKLKDIELIAMNLTAEYLSIDSECQLFRVIPDDLKIKIERSVYSRRKRKLFSSIEFIRNELSLKFNEFEKYFIIDSMPLEVTKLSRSLRSKICKEEFYTAPNRRYCASQKMHYYGYKIHAVCSVEGVFKSFDLSKAYIHDIHYLKDIKNQFDNCVILGNKVYLSADYQLDLKIENNEKESTYFRTRQYQCVKIKKIIRNKRIFLERKESE